MFIYDLMHPFTDPREDKSVIRTPDDFEQKFPNKELFYCLIDETERSFKEGMIVSATVSRVVEGRENMQARILCRLENGLDANVPFENVDIIPGRDEQSLFNTVATGSIITGRIQKIKFEEKFENQDNFSIILNCKKQDLINHSSSIVHLDQDLKIPQEDLININFKVQEDTA